MLTTFFLTIGGAPYCDNGDEIGMINAKFNKIEDYRDIGTLAEYEKVKIAGEIWINLLKSQTPIFLNLHNF